MRVLAAAFRNQPPMWVSTASPKTRSRPSRARSTCGGTLPLRNPGTLTDPARSEVACSTACFTSARGTSTVRRTRSSASSSTWVCTRPIQANGVRLPGSRRKTVERERVLAEDPAARLFALRRLERLGQHRGKRLPPPLRRQEVQLRRPRGIGGIEELRDRRQLEGLPQRLGGPRDVR